MMVAATVQAAHATQRGRQDLDAGFCSWIDREFRETLGSEEPFLRGE